MTIITHVNKSVSELSGSQRSARQETYVHKNKILFMAKLESARREQNISAVTASKFEKKRGDWRSKTSYSCKDMLLSQNQLCSYLIL